MKAPWSLICLVFAFVFFVLAAVLWPPTIEPYRMRLVAAGLAFLALAQLVGSA